MKVARVVCSVGMSSYFHMDFAAIRGGAKANGFIYDGKPVTAGFSRIIEPAETISIMLVLEDGQIAHGDCADVAFAGAAGRDIRLNAKDHLPVLEQSVVPLLTGLAIDAFRPLADRLENLQVDGKRLHTALRYGLSQAALHAVALAQRKQISEIVAAEYGLTISRKPIAIAASCELDDLRQLDRMILKRLEFLPHVFFTDVARQVGRSGEKFRDYVAYVAKRVQEIGASDYRPKLHFDMCGTLGELFELDIARLAEYLAGIAEAAEPFELLIEAPLVGDTQERHMTLFKALKDRVRLDGIAVKLVADEWCNTLEDVKRFAEAAVSDYVQIKMPDLGGVQNSIEAVLACKAHGMGACLGGTANETDQSTRISAQIGLACQPDYMLSKPGLGGDEGVMIERNEMARGLALLAR